MNVFLIDPIEKLKVYKDSSLYLAAWLKFVHKTDVRLFFLDDLKVGNSWPEKFKVYDFEAQFSTDSKIGELQALHLASEPELIDRQSIARLHMRLDPPYDTRYLQALWILREHERSADGLQVLNRPEALLKWNEKLAAYFGAKPQYSMNSLICRSNIKASDLASFGNAEDFIVKPLNLFQGEGVERVARDELLDPQNQSQWREKYEFWVVQAFEKKVTDGEIRSLFVRGEHVGSILKVPKPGEFLANVAQGAKFDKVDLDTELNRELSRIAHLLSQEGAPWVAFDILGGKVSEANITCPGLLVEVSKAHQANLCEPLWASLIEPLH